MTEKLTTRPPGGDNEPDEDTIESGQLTALASTAPLAGGVGEYARTYLARVRAGDLGSLPAIIGLIALAGLFSGVQSSFHSLNNLGNLIQQAAPTVVLAMGLVFVLLLGEIDLSAGTAAGAASAVGVKLMLKFGVPWWLGILAAVATGVLIGLFLGFVRAKLQVPSFVISLAMFLALQGVVLWVATGAGEPVHSKTISAIENSNMPIWLGWLLAVLVVVGFAVAKLLDALRRHREGLPAEPVALIALKVGGLAVLTFVVVYLLGLDRQPGGAHSSKPILTNVGGAFKMVKPPSTALQGVPWVVPIVVVLLVVWTVVLGRTRYGRHIYAVGGNAEAARRAGINVDRIRISAFVLCSAMAALAGIGLASNINSVSSDAGGGNTLLLAVGAAVIGGTSLFGGRGKMTDALVGGLVVQVINNGMGDLVHGDNAAAVQNIITGGVLAAAALVDATFRRKANNAGLG